MTDEEKEAERQRRETERQQWEQRWQERERQRVETERLERDRQLQREQYEAAAKLESYRNSIGWDFSIGGGVSLMMDSLDSYYKYNGSQLHFSIGRLVNRFNFVHAGLSLNWGAIGFNDDTASWDKIKAAHPGINDEINIKDADFGNNDFSSGFFNLGAFVKLYPADIMYLSGGVGFNWRYSDVRETDISLISVVEPVYSVGVGFLLIHLLLGFKHDNGGIDFVLEAQYNMVPLKERLGGYLSINLLFGVCRGGI
jgi:hypothetical protein